MTETPPVPRTPASRPNLVSVGTIIWLSSELMFFAALFPMYFTIRSVDKGQALHWPMAHLNLALASTNTTVLVLSSVTCQMGVFAIERDQVGDYARRKDWTISTSPTTHCNPKTAFSLACEFICVSCFLRLQISFSPPRSIDGLRCCPGPIRRISSGP